MRATLALTALLGLSNAAAIEPRQSRETKLYKIELGPDDVRTVTETENLQFLASFPSAVAQSSAVKALLPKLSQANLRTTLTTFSNFYNRYYTSAYGEQSADWLFQQVESIISASGAKGVKVAKFKHTWRQPSIIATIPGKSDSTIVVDDDGSGTVTILEAFRVLLSDSRVASGEAPNTIEFHWYSGEEAGLLGSGAVFNQYKREGRPVKAMLNQDMTGYVKPGTKAVAGVITDNVDAGLSAFLKKVIAAYSSLPAVDSKCGYGCSDHASATRAGYPAALAFESTFEDSSPYIHSDRDTIDTVNFSHMLEFSKIVTGFAYELGFATNL
ncbi:hypothetical protein FGSG_01818 [Fusarium graminearum PH-1]|uniref:hypothetical protein n=1 Tax=Gibberella zeae (strain ATCC MYA-4620 / CBS 123657 / FGSC 9075 / NRRL 31084 / PH-1) TaxID=229533 RepID=UPI00021F201B|nr:hypothetical protein FGSG_01818 [Fusarium graminearum PH-1]ESU07173.1 hypothetical protein FGSG_01818 [Fusarium graminearum PH-1]|eukprot:XP_011317658.1 hypothetical protein FGSG_01818 [Fusarium graminearum PH-1]